MSVSLGIYRGLWPLWTIGKIRSVEVCSGAQFKQRNKKNTTSATDVMCTRCAERAIAGEMGPVAFLQNQFVNLREFA